MKKKNITSASRRAFVRTSAQLLGGFFIVPRYVLGGQQPNGVRYIAPSDRIQVGIIGSGKQGRFLASQFAQTGESNIVAISEVYQAKAQLTLDSLKKLYAKKTELGSLGEIAMYTDFREMLQRKDVDAVIIATPDHWHAAAAVRAAEAGKDIYCEKPMALTVKEGRAMVKATRKYNRVFQTGNMQRSWNEFRHAVELVRNGYIGDIQKVRVNIGAPPIPYTLPAQPIPEGLDWNLWLGPNDPSAFNEELAPPVSKDVFPNWRLYKEFGGGMVTDWGAHMFDIAQWALDMDESGPVSFKVPDGKDIMNLTMEYSNGTQMTHEKWEWGNAVHFIGSAGEIKVGRGQLETSPVQLKKYVMTDKDKRVYYSNDHYKDFFQAIRKRSRPLSDVETGHRTASVCNIANIAYQLNRNLAWDPVKEKFNQDDEANQLLGRPMNNEWKIKL